MLPCFSAVLVLAAGAQAEMMLSPPQAGTSATPQRQIVYKQRTEIDFEGVDVSGELIKPQGPLPITAPVPRQLFQRATPEENRNE